MNAGEIRGIDPRFERHDGEWRPTRAKAAVDDVVSARYGLQCRPANNFIPTVGLAAKNAEATDRDCGCGLKKHRCHSRSMTKEIRPAGIIWSLTISSSRKAKVVIKVSPIESGMKPFDAGPGSRHRQRIRFKT